MLNYPEYEGLDGPAIYRALANTWQIASIDRRPEWKECLLAPIYDGYAPIGAAIVFGLLAYPDAPEKQSRFVRLLAAAIIKSSSGPHTAERKQLRADPATSWALDIPNKSIQQSYESASKLVAKRFRAARVLWRKLASSGDPDKQSPLLPLILQEAQTHTRTNPAFHSEAADQEDQDEAIADSFRRRVIRPAVPVIHLAMAIETKLSQCDDETYSLKQLTLCADNWLKGALIAAEQIRVMLGDMYPRHDTKYVRARGIKLGSQGHERNEEMGIRVQNFSAPMNRTIAVLPFIDPIPDEWNVATFLDRNLYLKTILRQMKIKTAT